MLYESVCFARTSEIKVARSHLSPLHFTYLHFFPFPLHTKNMDASIDFVFEAINLQKPYRELSIIEKIYKIILIPICDNVALSIEFYRVTCNSTK